VSLFIPRLLEIFKPVIEEKNIIFSDMPLSELLNAGKRKWTKNIFVTSVCVKRT
jgi:hypothetical protein